MISFEQALKIILSNVSTIGTSRIPMLNTLKYVLAEDIMSDIDMPPFDKAAMDGYACRRSDINMPLEVIEDIPAGKFPQRSIVQGQCSRIMTGAPVPQGADFIIMKENVLIDNDGKVICSSPSGNVNICFKGEDVKSGDKVLLKGTSIQPQHIAVLAATGNIEPLVYKKPSVAILSTGNELVEPDKIPEDSKIRNSNGYQVFAQLLEIGITPQYLGIALDNEEQLTKILRNPITSFDIIIISGGVSVGDYDFVPKILVQEGVEILFHGLNAKPGKHLLFGKKDDRFIVGLPGNPVSSFVQMEVLIKPLLNKIMGSSKLPTILNIPISETYRRKKSDGLAFVPVTIDADGKVVLPEYHGSAHIHAFAGANGIMEIPVGVNEIKKGDFVRVRPL